LDPENLALRDRAKKYNQAMEETRGTQDFEAEKIIVNAEATKMYPQLKTGD
jgi:hypothetical protein